MATAAVLIVSDTRTAGTRSDETTPIVTELLEGAGITVTQTRLVADEQAAIEAALIELCAAANLVITSGGTGFAPRDVTPEATRAVLDRAAPGLAEAMRAQTAQVTPQAWLSRAVTGLRGRSLIVNLPGSPKGVRECLEVILPLLPHALAQGTGARDDVHTE